MRESLEEIRTESVTSLSRSRARRYLEKQMRAATREELAAMTCMFAFLAVIVILSFAVR
jgi:hypothetical protein